MPEHDEPDAPEKEELTKYVCPHCGNRLSKTDRWGVEDKVVDGESK